MGDTTDYERTDRPWTAQPPPVHIPDAPSAHDLVIADMADRKAYGLRKHGTILQADNGRDHLRDAYEEALDLVVYLRCAITAQDARNALHSALPTHTKSSEINTITHTLTG
jgi:hypothetical protein